MNYQFCRTLASASQSSVSSSPLTCNPRETTRRKKIGLRTSHRVLSLAIALLVTGFGAYAQNNSCVTNLIPYANTAINLVPFSMVSITQAPAQAVSYTAGYLLEQIAPAPTFGNWPVLIGHYEYALSGNQNVQLWSYRAPIPSGTPPQPFAVQSPDYVNLTVSFDPVGFVYQIGKASNPPYISVSITNTSESRYSTSFAAQCGGPNNSLLIGSDNMQTYVISFGTPQQQFE